MADINTDMAIILREMTPTMPSSFHLNNGRARVYISHIGSDRPSQFKNDTFIL